MPRLADASYMTPAANLRVDHHDCCLLLGSLRDSLAKEQGTLTTLLITRDRELTRVERFALPYNLRLLSRDDLREQIDAWVSLVSMIQWLMKKTEEAEWILTPPSLKRRRERGEIL